MKCIDQIIFLRCRRPLPAPSGGQPLAAPRSPDSTCRRLYSQAPNSPELFICTRAARIAVSRLRKIRTAACGSHYRIINYAPSGYEASRRLKIMHSECEPRPETRFFSTLGAGSNYVDTWLVDSLMVQARAGSGRFPGAT